MNRSKQIRQIYVTKIQSERRRRKRIIFTLMIKENREMFVIENIGKKFFFFKLSEIYF